MPTDRVRGLKAHGSSPAKTKLAGEFLPLVAARFFPGQPCAKSGIGLRRWFGIGKHAGDWAIMERIDGGMPPRDARPGGWPSGGFPRYALLLICRHPPFFARGSP